MLISLHLPKTAGTSFLESLRRHYGDALLEDYSDQPLHRSALVRRRSALRAALRNRFGGPPDSVQCIHGHFLPLKYRTLRARPLRFVTWLRDPLERLASHYHYWLREYDPMRAGSLHRRVVEEHWSFEEFCLSPRMRNTYSTFLWGFDPARFDFIGITEHYEQDMARFCKEVLGTELSAELVNVNPTAPPRSYFEDEALRQRVARYHARDVALYEWALQRR